MVWRERRIPRNSVNVISKHKLFGSGTRVSESNEAIILTTGPGPRTEPLSKNMLSVALSASINDGGVNGSIGLGSKSSFVIFS